MFIWNRFAILFLSLFVLSFVPSASAQKSQRSQGKRPPHVRFINPTTMSKPTGYTHVVEVTGGKTIYVAGQVAIDQAGEVVGRGDFRAQAQQVFENLKAALEASGASFKDVVKLNYYTVDMSQLPVLREVRDKYVNTVNPPASTAVEVRRLFRQELMLEIEAIAVVPE